MEEDVTERDFLGFVESFFLKLSARIFPLYGRSRSIDEENHLV